MHDVSFALRSRPRGRSNAGCELMVFLMSGESRLIAAAEMSIDGGQTSGAIAKVLSDAARGDQR